MYIEKAHEATQELLEALQQLIPQLGAHKLPPTREELAALIQSESSTLLMARYPDEEGPITGILSLTIYRVPTGVRSIVEDVVVDENMRRRGIGAELLRHAIALAREAGANGVALTSNARREAANRLYRALDFKQRDTNAYMYELQ